MLLALATSGDRRETLVKPPRNVFMSSRPKLDPLRSGYHLFHDVLSTNRCQTGILMNVHPVPPKTLKLRNLSFLGSNRMDNVLKAHS